jgi:hypothetical protein
MATSVHFRHNVRSEQSLYENLIVESLKFYGQDVYYLPREVVTRDMVFNDDILSEFRWAFKVEVYVENVEGYDGEGDLFQKFGVEIRDAATLVMARRRFNSEIRQYQETKENVFYRPREGDLIHIPLSGSTFEIMKVEDENPFYQLGQLPVFRMRVELFEYSGERFGTGTYQGIDDIEEFAAYQWQLTMDSASNGFTRGERVTQAFDDYVVTGEVVHWSDSDNVMRLANVGNTSGEYKTFTTTRQIYNGDSVGARTSIVTPTVVMELQQIQSGAAGGDINPTGASSAWSSNVTDFDVSVLEFVDFSEDNPFGDFS